MRHKINKSYIMFSKENNEIVIDKLFVDPNERGQHLGYKLLDVAKKYADKKGLNLALYAESDDPVFSNYDLVEYYRNYGFESNGDCDQLMTY